MADEEIENLDEGGDSGQPKSAGGGGSKVIIIIAAVVLVFLLLVGGVIAFLLSGSDNEVNMEDAPTTLDQQASGAKTPARARVQATNYITIGPIHELDLFLVNLISKRGKRYLRVKVSLELDSENVIAELELKKVVISDAIIDTLTSRTKEELSTSKGKSRLKDELVDRINSSLVDGTIKNVFFTEFIIQ